MVSYAAVRSKKTVPVLRFFWNLFSQLQVLRRTKHFDCGNALAYTVLFTYTCFM